MSPRSVPSPVVPLDAAALPPRPAPVPAAGLPLLERLLRDRAGIAAAIREARAPAGLTTGLVALAAGGAAAYGAAVGLTGGPAQAVVCAVKMPLVLLGAAGISLPALHVACALAGAELRFGQLRDLVLQALATATITMAGLAPLITIGWLTVSIDGGGWMAYRRAVLAAVAVAAVGCAVGAARLLRSVPVSAALPWSLAFAFSAAQLSWLLRPLVGMPDAPFVLLRPLESNALAAILTAIGAVLR